MSYYTPHTDPHHSSRLSVEIERPTISRPDGGIMRHDPGPRMRLVIEGEHDYVERLAVAIKPTVDEIRAEIEA